jgi:hypothetical protein
MRNGGRRTAPRDPRERTRSRSAAFFAVLFLVAGAAAAGFARHRAATFCPQETPGDPLPRILERTREYCRKLGSASLNFVCAECVEAHEYSPPIRLFSTTPTGGVRRVKSESFVYDYQLVASGTSIKETRTLVRENGEPRDEKNATIQTRIFKHENLIFGPVGLLSEYWQPRHAYSYIGEDRSGGVKAFLVEAGPSGPPEPGHLYGKVWVSQDDFSVLKIEWDQKSLGNFPMIERMARSIGPDTVPGIVLTAEYGVEKNGIRFPSQVTILEDYLNIKGTVRLSETTIVYKDYKFFTVDTNVRY